MANSNNWGEIYKSTWWGDKAWSANTLFIDSAPPGFGLNLLKGSEDLDNTIDWDRLPDTTDVPTVSANTITDPNGGTTAERVDFSANRQARLQQRVTLEASKEYTFSIYAKVNTGTQNFRLRNVTLGDAESKTATTSWTRFSYTFTTTTAGDYDLSLQNNDNTARTLEFWGAMLNEGATAGDYVKTDASVSGSAPAPAYSGFGDAFGGVTAYYSLRQFTEAETLNAIRVRRSSDDTEQDIGFDANGDLDSTALTTFVNEDVNTYSSDFSSGIDGLIESRVTASSVDGISDGTTSKDDVLQSVLTSGSNTHYIYKNGTFDLSNTYDVSFEYYIPSVRPDGVTPQTIDGIVVRTGTGSDGAYPFSVLDSWESETIQNWSPSTSNLLLFAAAVGEFIGSIDADGDVYYLKNIVVTQTTADGAVTTWYDQTGNGNDATKITESEQPLVVSGGTLVTENGKAAIDFDGVDDEFAISVPITAGFSVFGVYKNTKAGSYLIGNSPELGRRGTNQYRFNDIGFSANGGTHSDSQVLLTGIEDDTNATIYANGTQVAQAVSTFTSATLLQIGKNSPDGTFQEIILFDSDQSSNRGTVTTGGGTLIEGNINTYFDIV